jgi:Ca2+:H+ antiporter
VFPVCFLSIVALEEIFEWGGEQLAMYCGPDLGDLVVITLNKCVCLTLVHHVIMLTS